MATTSKAEEQAREMWGALESAARVMLSPETFEYVWATYGPDAAK